MKTILLSIFFTISIFAGNGNIQHQISQINQNFFIENIGQWPAEVKYLAKMGGMNAWITNFGVVYDYYQINRNYNETETLNLTPDKKDEFERNNTSVKGHVVKMRLVNANTASIQQENNKQEGYYNYFIGNDKNKWASNVPLYGDVEQDDIYKSINVKYYFDRNSIRYDYIVKPGADLSQLRLKFEGQESISVNDAGELVIKTSLGKVTNGKLYSYQTDNGINKEINCRFLQNENGTISFNATGYERDKELIIDPLVYYTFVGGNGDDFGYSIAADVSGNAYITGYTASINFPTTLGAYQTTLDGGTDVFVTKLNPIGNALVYSTFIGGSGSGKDISYSIAVDTSGNAYITGYTWSSNYPTTPGAYQTTGGGIFITKLNNTGNGLVYSTFIGGGVSCSIAIDASGNAYISGYTTYTNYPITPGAYQTTGGGSQTDAIVTKINPTGSALVYSTYIGGSWDDYGYSIAIDVSGNAYITGVTRSSNYPITAGAYQTTKRDGYDAIVTKLNPTGSALVYSTYIGGSDDDFGYSIATDTSGNAYITGFGATDYPTTPGAYKITSSGYDAIVTKLNPTGSALVYSTFIGGSYDDKGYSIAIDASRNAYITGYTSSSNYPTTLGAYQTTHGSYWDAFVTKLNPVGSALLYSTFVGGDGDDVGNSIAIDASGNAYLTGTRQTYPGNYKDVFVTKLNIPPTFLQLTSPNGGEEWEGNTVHNITWLEGTTPSSIKIDFSTDAGSTWINLNTVTPGKGTYNWTVPPFSCTTTKVRVSIVALPEYNSQSSQNFALTTNPAPAVFVTSPNGGNLFKIGSVQNITWTASVGISNLNIELTADKGATWNIVANNVPTSSGIYAWTVPNIPSVNCKIRLTESSKSTIYDVSDDVFTIEKITVTGPNGGEIWKSGTSQLITWDHIGTTNVKIEYSSNNGTNWSTISSSYSASSGSYSWTVPAISSAQCLIRISDASNISVSDKSDNPFRIWQPIANNQTPIVGQNTLSFGTTDVSLDMFVFTPAQITTTFYEYEAPQSGTLPSGINRVSQYYWTISPSGTISFVNGYIEVPVSNLRAVNNPANLVWLKRINSSDSWTNIGGSIISGKLVSTNAFASFSEFAIGTTGDDPLIVQVEIKAPDQFMLMQNYPNPFNPSTKINYTLPFASKITLEVYNITGERIGQLVNEEQSAGFYSIDFSSSLINRSISSGVYFYRITAVDKATGNNFSSIKKMILLK